MPRSIKEYLHEDGNISEITEKVYAMEKETGMKSGTLQKEANSCRKNKLSNGNRREKVED